METLSPEESQSLASNIANEILRRIAQSLAGAQTGGQTAPLMSRGGGLGWNCTGKSFTCGTYECTGIVGCSGDFGCTIKFSG